jgi:hypothetical protein
MVVRPRNRYRTYQSYEREEKVRIRLISSVPQLFPDDTYINGKEDAWFIGKKKQRQAPGLYLD